MSGTGPSNVLGQVATVEPRRVAVVGAGGFIGSALIRRLSRRSHLSTQAFTRANPPLHDGVLNPALAKADVVYWLASSINPALANSKPELVRCDYDLLSSTVTQLSEAASPPQLVLVSSGGTVYDAASPPPYHEASSTSGSSSYARAKLAMEDAVLSHEGIPACILRVSNAYGPGQPTGKGQGVIAHWLASALEGSPIVILGDPETTRDYVYIGDVVTALELVGRNTFVPKIVNIGSGKPTTLKELERVIMAVVGVPLKETKQPSREFDLSSNWLNIGLAASALAWAPRVELRYGISLAWSALNSCFGSHEAARNAVG